MEYVFGERESILRIVHITQELQKQAKEEIGMYYRDLSSESLAFRYIWYKTQGMLFPQKVESYPFFFSHSFWSISHTKESIFMVQSKRQVGCDIQSQSVGVSLFLHREEEYECFWQKNHDACIALWVWKESVTKLVGKWMEIIAHIRITSCLDYSWSVFFKYGISLYEEQWIETFIGSYEGNMFAISFYL